MMVTLTNGSHQSNCRMDVGKPGRLPAVVSAYEHPPECSLSSALEFNVKGIQIAETPEDRDVPELMGIAGTPFQYVAFTASYVLAIVDDALEPAIHRNDYVLCQSWGCANLDAIEGHLCDLSLNGESLIRRVQVEWDPDLSDLEVKASRGCERFPHVDLDGGPQPRRIWLEGVNPKCKPIELRQTDCLSIRGDVVAVLDPVYS